MMSIHLLLLELMTQHQLLQYILLRHGNNHLLCSLSLIIVTLSNSDKSRWLMISFICVLLNACFCYFCVSLGYAMWNTMTIEHKKLLQWWDTLISIKPNTTLVFLLKIWLSIYLKKKLNQYDMWRWASQKEKYYISNLKNFYSISTPFSFFFNIFLLFSLDTLKYS